MEEEELVLQSQTHEDDNAHIVIENILKVSNLLYFYLKTKFLYNI